MKPIQRFEITEGDTGPALEVNLHDGNKRIPDLTGATVKFNMRVYVEDETLPEGTLVIDHADAEILEETLPQEAASLLIPNVRYPWQPGDTSLSTDVEYCAEFEVTSPTLGTQTFPTGGRKNKIRVAIRPEVA